MDEPAFEEVSPRDAAQMIERGECYVIDVRTPYEFAQYRIAGAHLLPVQELRERHGEIPRAPEKKLLVYCEHGVRSAGTCQVLAENGWTRLVNMDGGMDAWMQAGLPHASGSATDAVRLGPPAAAGSTKPETDAPASGN
jgi:rhodanese-related sulfurtransferase